MMTLEQAIQHCKEVAEQYEAYGIETECYECAKEHRKLAEWLEDYRQLKADCIKLNEQLRAANAENEELRLSLKISNDLLHCKIVGDAMWDVIIEKSKQMEEYLTKPPVPADKPCGGDSNAEN